jgi:hypothetical protein
MVLRTTKPRRGGDPSLGRANKADDQIILLARGLSSRSVGANIPLLALSSDEGERDLRHMEAFTNACTAYSHQFYIYTNGKNAGNVGSKGDDGDDPNEAPTSSSQSHHAQAGAPPLIAMPIRIDPEEEKRLVMLRQKIQQGEAQREILESQYVSLRAQYVYLSKLLTKLRTTSNRQQSFLQRLVQKRGALLAVQRVRLEVARDVLDALKYRAANSAATSAQAHSSPSSSANRDEGKVDFASSSSTDLIDVWNLLESKFKSAEKACRHPEEDGDSKANVVEPWVGQKMPKTPFGVPVLLSQLSSYHDFAMAFGTNGILGSSASTMCWLEKSLPDTMTQQAKVASSVTSLREETRQLRLELEQERQWNKELQTNIISRRKLNDELVAMVTLLRTETEAIVARHNILLESDQARDAAYSLHEEEQLLKQSATNQDKEDSEDPIPEENLGEPEIECSTTNDSTNAGGDMNEEENETKPLVSSVSDSAAVADDAGALDDGEPSSRPEKQQVEDDENDGDDEGELSEEDEDEEDGEIVEGEDGEVSDEKEDSNGNTLSVETGDATSKRTLSGGEESGSNEMPGSANRSAKRRKL